MYIGQFANYTTANILKISKNNSFGMSCNDGTPYISSLIKILYQRWTKFSDNSNYMHGFPGVKKVSSSHKRSNIKYPYFENHQNHQYDQHQSSFSSVSHFSHILIHFALGWCSFLWLTSLTLPRQKMMAVTEVWGPWGHEHRSKEKYRPIPQNH